MKFLKMSSRPENRGPPEYFYDETEARKYTENSRIIEIQKEMSERALELLGFDQEDEESKLILDLGCGSALSGQVIQSAGHYLVGMDISRPMLQIAKSSLRESQKNRMELDDPIRISPIDASSSDESDEESALSQDETFGLLLSDMGQGICCRPGIFDAAISVSALQWLCHSNRSFEDPRRRLNSLFTSLFAVLSHGARAVFQFYPGDERQTEMVLSSARKCGFGGGLVVDFPDSPRAKKYYLCLMTSAGTPIPNPRTCNQEDQH